MAAVAVRAFNNIGISRCSYNCLRLKSKWKLSEASLGAHRTFVNSSVRLSDRKYSEKHEWVELDGKVGTIGITNYAQEALGDIVYAQLPGVGEEFSKMDECGALESVKAASELFTPISGKIFAINESLADEPSLINQSCYEKGWLFKVELSIPDEVSDLMNEEEYEKFLKEQ